MPHFIGRNLDSPLELVGPALARLVATRRLPPARSEGRSVLPRRAAAPPVLLPGDVCRPGPGARAGDLRGDHLHGLRRGRVLPAGRHARGAARARRAPPRAHGVRFRFEHHGHAASRSPAAGPGGASRRTATACPPTSSSSTPTCPPPTPSCCRPGYTPRRVRRLRYSPSAVVLHAGSSATYDDPAHHTIDFGAAWDDHVSPDHRPRRTHERPVVPADQSDAHRSARWPRPAGTPTSRCFPTPNLRRAPTRSTGRATASATATTSSPRSRRADTRVSATASSASTW